MSINRRTFFSLIFLTRSRSTSLPVQVLETFDSRERTIALLVHHADAAGRTAFSEALRTHSGSKIGVRDAMGRETEGILYRTRMCFGRGLIVMQAAAKFREAERLTVMFGEAQRVK